MAETLGDRMRMHRARLRLSQGALGKLVGLGANSISALETGEVDPRLDVMRRIAKALGVPFMYLVGEDEESDRLPTEQGPGTSLVPARWVRSTQTASTEGSIHGCANCCRFTPP